MSGFKGIVEAIARDLEERLLGQRATQRRKLSELVGGMLICQTPNLMELSNVLDRPTESGLMDVTQKYRARTASSQSLPPEGGSD
jgi:hypothetical protein